MNGLETYSTSEVLLDSDLAKKQQILHDSVASLGSTIVAFSGGVDSTYLAWAATNILGSQALCITADSPSYSNHYRELSLRIANEFGLNHEIIKTDELDRPEYRANPVNRCYYCKHELYSVLKTISRDRGITGIVDGSNADDRSDYRPGRSAAREFGVKSPLDEADLTKVEIRELSRRVGLPTWNEPASACLSSRIPYHSEVTNEKLRMVEQAEATLHELGFRVCRVRHYGALARVEIGLDEMSRVSRQEIQKSIEQGLFNVGYQHVIIDPQGYRMGSLNKGINLRQI